MQPDDVMESFLSSRKCECVRVVECFKVRAEVSLCVSCYFKLIFSLSSAVSAGGCAKVMWGLKAAQ